VVAVSYMAASVLSLMIFAPISCLASSALL